MKKVVVLMMSAALVVTGLNAQAPVSPLAEGVKMLNYEKNKSALTFFKEALDKNPGDPETTFWYGQAILSQNYNGVSTPESIQQAKTLYQQALQAKGNDAWLLVGMAHIQSLEGADANAVKQNLEVAITSSLATKGKYKGKPNPDVVNAIGRVFAEFGLDLSTAKIATLGERVEDVFYVTDSRGDNLYDDEFIGRLKDRLEHELNALSGALSDAES